jgi:hypothetical protein
MGWNLEGMVIWARYMGEFDVCGRVESSRVKYGGEVQHTIVLAEPVEIYGQMRDRLLIEHKYVTRVSDSKFTVKE